MSTPPPLLRTRTYELRRLTTDDLGWVWDLRFHQQHKFRWLTREAFAPLETFRERLKSQRLQFVGESRTGERVAYAVAYELDECSRFATICVVVPDPATAGAPAPGAVAQLFAGYLFTCFDIRKVIAPVLSFESHGYKGPPGTPPLFESEATLQAVEYVDGTYWDVDYLTASRVRWEAQRHREVAARSGWRKR